MNTANDKVLTLIVCPLCNCAYRLAHSGLEYRRPCPRCRAMQHFRFDPDKPERLVSLTSCQPQPTTAQPTAAPYRNQFALTVQGTRTREFILPEGLSSVGRAETDSLRVADDDSVSRNSLECNVYHDPANGRWRCRLTVLRTTNPVTVAHRHMAAGQSADLEHGQLITLGKTTLRFTDKHSML